MLKGVRVVAANRAKSRIERNMDEPSVELTIKVWPKRVRGLGRFWGLIACTRYITIKVQSVHFVTCSSGIRR